MSWFGRNRRAAAPPRVAEACPADAGPRAPSALAAEVLAAAADARGDVHDRIAEVNRLTEREVMSAARNVHSILENTSGTIGKLRHIAERFEGDGGRDGVARAIAAQTEMVRAFVEELVALARAQAEATLGAQRTMTELGKATRSIDTLASEAKILALNSRIEAGRAGSGSTAISVVSDEMRRLATAVAATNTKVRDLSTSVGTALQAVVAKADGTRARIERFAAESAAGTKELRAEVDSFRADASGALADNDRHMAESLRCSQAALSNLQFQDVIAQGLLRLDARMRDLQVRLAEAVGARDAIAGLAPPAHSEVGGDKAVVHASAGEVQLF